MKLTASDLIRMAAAQGIALVQAGTPTPHNGDVDALRRDNARLSVELARVIALPLNGSAETLAELDRQRAEANKWRQAYEGMRMQRQEPANGAELSAARDALARAIEERDEARAKAPDIMGDSQATRDAQATIVKLQGERFNLQGELAEARAEVESLKRTVDKLRPLAQRGDSIPQARPEPVRTMLRVTFNGFPGWAIVAELRKFGIWHKVDKAWHLADTAEAQAYLQSLTISGMAVEVRG